MAVSLLLILFLIHMFTSALCVSAAKVINVNIYMYIASTIYIANTDCSQCLKFCNRFFPLEKLLCIQQECDLRKRNARWLGKLSMRYMLIETLTVGEHV